MIEPIYCQYQADKYNEQCKKLDEIYAKVSAYIRLKGSDRIVHYHHTYTGDLVVNSFTSEIDQFYLDLGFKVGLDDRDGLLRPHIRYDLEVQY